MHRLHSLCSCTSLSKQKGEILCNMAMTRSTVEIVFPVVSSLLLTELENICRLDEQEVAMVRLVSNRQLVMYIGNTLPDLFGSAISILGSSLNLAASLIFPLPQLFHSSTHLRLTISCDYLSLHHQWSHHPLLSDPGRN